MAQLDLLNLGVRDKNNNNKLYEQWVKYGSGYIYNGRTDIETLVIPSGYKTLGVECFKGLPLLKKVIVPEGVKALGPSCFEDCTALEEVVLPKSLQTIDDSCFAGCTSLKHIKLPMNLSIIGESAFSETSLKEIIIPTNVKVLNRFSFYGCHELKSVKMGLNVTKIKSLCFADCDSLVDIKLSPSLTEIGLSCFDHCKSIEKLNIPNSVRFIDSGAFNDCWNLKELNLPSSLRYIDHSFFKNNDSLTFLKLPNGVEEVFNYAFTPLKNLETVILPQSVTRIGHKAFANLKKLTTVVMNPLILDEKNKFSEEKEYSNDSFLGCGVFTGCSSLKMVNQTIIKNGIFKVGSILNSYLKNKEEIVISEKENIKEIGSFAFSELNRIKSIKLPSSIKRIDSYACKDCVNLVSIEVPETVKEWGIDILEGCNKIDCECVRTIGYYQYINRYAVSFLDKESNKGSTLTYDCQSRDVSFPIGVKGFAEGLFSGLNIFSCKIPEGVTELPRNMFNTCRYLKNVKLPTTLKKIGEGAFLNDFMIEEINIPENCVVSENNSLEQKINYFTKDESKSYK